MPASFPFPNDGSVVTDSDYVLIPSRTGWHKFNFNLVSGTGDITLKENNVALPDWSAVTAAQEKLIWGTTGVPITVTVDNGSSFVPHIIFG